MYESCFFFFDLKTDECASWVQAWGTIAAVIATGFFTWLQHRFDLERDRVAEREKSVRLIKLGISSAQGVIDLLSQARHDLTDPLTSWILGSKNQLRLGGALKTYEECLRSIQKADLPNIEVAKSIIGLELATTDAIALAQSLDRPPVDPMNRFAQFDRVITALMAHRDRLEKAVQSESLTPS